MAKSLKSFLSKKYPEAVSVNMLTDVTYIDTRIPTLNYVMTGKPKTGGMPLNGKIVCIFGPEACLDENSIIDYYEYNLKSGNFANKEGGTIKQLYEDFNSLSINNNDRSNTDFYIKSIIPSEKNIIINQPIADVVKTGLKECFKVTTKNGKVLVSTKDHKYYTENSNFLALEDLKVGDTIYSYLTDDNDASLKNRYENSQIAEDEIISIVSVGERETYDIKCFTPFNNYIANDIVVHNSGKTSLVLQLIREVQRADIEVVFIDTERSITQPRTKQFGVDLDKLIYAAPDTMEECFSMIEDIYKEKADTQTLDEPIVIIWDSLAATPTKAEISRTSDQVEIASQAGVLTRNLRRIRGKIKKMNAGLVLVQQARANQDRYGDIFSMPGGFALQHTVDMILRVNKMKPNESDMGVKISTPIKNRLFKPFQNTTIQFDYTAGFTQENVILSFCEFLKNIEILGQSGAWCYLQSDVNDIMEKDPEITEKEAKSSVSKFYLKDFAKRLLEDESYYKEILDKAEEYVNKNTYKVAKIMIDEEVPIEIRESNSEEVEIKDSDDSEDY